MVLLSGGMDSTACLRWCLTKYRRDVRAIGFDYGQPARDAELSAAGRLARKLSVPFELVALADTMHAGLLDGVPTHDETAAPIHRAFVPGRNLVFLSIALGRACCYWPNEPEIHLAIGCCAEDRAGFPDCREPFLRLASTALSAAVGRTIHVAAPFVRTPKATILRDAHPAALVDLQESWSCYAGGKAPCGACSACVLRSRAFAVVGLPDLARGAVMHGGDVHRERRLR